MKTSQMFIVLTALVAVCLIPTVLSLRCYICNNLADPKGCAHGKDTVDKKYLMDCSHQSNDDGQQGSNTNYTLCRKITTWIDFDVNTNKATERIVRKCGYLDSQYNDKCYYRGGFGGRQQVCSCLTDDCNSGFTFRANHILLGAGAIVVLIFGSKI